MSYVPLRDRYRFDDDTNARLEALADLIEADARKALHVDQCGCDDDACPLWTQSTYTPPAEEVLAYALEQGWLTLPTADSSRPAPVGSWWETPDGAAYVDGDYVDGPGDQIVTYVLHRRDGQQAWGKWGGREFADAYTRLDGPPAWCTSGTNLDLTD